MLFAEYYLNISLIISIKRANVAPSPATAIIRHFAFFAALKTNKLALAASLNSIGISELSLNVSREFVFSHMTDCIILVEILPLELKIAVTEKPVS